MGRPAKMSPDQERLNLMVETTMRAAIRDFRFQERYDSEGDAVRELLRVALEAKGVTLQPSA
jgi:hypothetical protein